MPTALDVAFVAQRERLAQITQQNVVRLWTLNHNDREREIEGALQYAIERILERLFVQGDEVDALIDHTADRVADLLREIVDDEQAHPALLTL